MTLPVGVWYVHPTPPVPEATNGLSNQGPSLDATG
jgi:hypothetical protein